MQFIEVGRVAGLFGVSGWVRIQSYTDPEENILNYQPWILRKDQDEQVLAVIDSEHHSKGLVVKCADIDDKETARLLLGWRIFIRQEQLPTLLPEQYYWKDLQGLTVETQRGVSLGKVVYLFETGANDVLVVEGDRQRLIPYVPGQVIKQVDLLNKIIIVEWDPEF